MSYSVGEKLRWNTKTQGVNATEFLKAPKGIDQTKLYLAVNNCINAKHHVEVIADEKGNCHDATKKEVYVRCCEDKGHTDVDSSWKGWIPTEYLDKVDDGRVPSVKPS